MCRGFGVTVLVVVLFHASAPSLQQISHVASLVSPPGQLFVPPPRSTSSAIHLSPFLSTMQPRRRLQWACVRAVLFVFSTRLCPSPVSSLATNEHDKRRSIPATTTSRLPGKKRMRACVFSFASRRVYQVGTARCADITARTQEPLLSRSVVRAPSLPQPAKQNKKQQHMSSGASATPSRQTQQMHFEAGGVAFHVGRPCLLILRVAALAAT